METGCQSNSNPRLLVVIASFGEKNLELLRRVIARYRAMTLPVDVVVVSNAPKDLGPDVEVVVGLPTNDPWSLPFAHKAVMARKLEQYDLFAYSEDDMEVTEENIRAFLRVAPLLAADEIAGFLRYEADSFGNRTLPEVHDCYRWIPESARPRGSLVVAEFTNEHAAFFLLTRPQLRQAIASGGFLRAPYRGRHDMACSAATDPYTSCGFRKVVCVSELEDFLIHHASNRYSGKLGPSLAAFQEQIQALIQIGRQTRPAKTLCAVEPRVPGHWGKDLYESATPEWLKAAPKEARTVLSVGCGEGAFETEMQRRGAAVTALPMDSVIGAAVERRGIPVIYGTLDEAFHLLGSRQFHCVALSHLLHLAPDPEKVIDLCAQRVAPGGRFLISGPNFNRFPILLKRNFCRGDERKMRSFSESGITLCGPASLAKRLRRCGLRVASVHWRNHSALLGKGGPPAVELGGLTAKDWVLTSVRSG